LTSRLDGAQGKVQNHKPDGWQLVASHRLMLRMPHIAILITFRHALCRGLALD
jgi:hypothetical protein